ncbi:MAG: ABC-ATPase domain-containing protein [Deltaproteobacteria bacterium]|nr:ABC-ATPase domain-containing protein [Deltaproteobacteria bacterium]
MPTLDDLRRTLGRIDGRGYKAYKDLEGSYQAGEFLLHVDHVQGDPFAAPSRIRVQVPQERAQFPRGLFSTPVRRLALRDYLARAFARAIEAVVRRRRGMGTSGLIAVDAGGQEVLDRSAVGMDPRMIEVRFVMGLPAAGRSVLGREAEAMFCTELPQIVRRALFFANLPAAEVEAFVDCVEDQEALRAALGERGLVAFVGDGAILPRRSGVDERPLGQGAVAFEAPSSLAVEVPVPNRGRIRGMGIPQGVTLIVGGGFHGKSTLLRALERGVYAHVPGDGRELVAALPGAVKIRAEDGRAVTQVNISPFITHLPLGRDTARFSTENASGSTSQAANIMEALEVGASLLLIDEDTSATNFMIRDRRMQALVAKAKEPITPFLDKVRQLFKELGVSTILVMGGSGDYFDVADTVLMMDEYRPRDVTGEARAVIRRYGSGREPEGGEAFGAVTPRAPLPEGFDPSRGRREARIDAKGLQTIVFGTTAIDLSCVEQLVAPSQTRAIGELIHYYAEHYADGRRPLREGLGQALRDLDARGFDVLGPGKRGDLARPRIFELAAAVNRLRTLQVRLSRRQDGV